MIRGRVQNTGSDNFDGHFALLGAMLKEAVRDARVARRRPADDADVQFAGDWLRSFAEGSRYERSILELSGLDGDAACKSN